MLPLPLLLLLLLSVHQPMFIQCIQDKDYESIVLKSERRLTNAEPVPKGRWPFMVAILMKNNKNQVLTPHCSGEILNKYFILTAAHCLVKKPESSLVVVFGSKPIRSPLLTIAVESVSIHPQYNVNRTTSDIGILKLIHPIPRMYMHPVKLISSIYNNRQMIRSYDVRPMIYGNHCLALGYGPPKHNEYSVDDVILRQLQMPLLTKQSCRASLRFFYNFYDRFCASNQHEYLAGGGLPPFKSVTGGDSGGAFICPIRTAAGGSILKRIRSLLSSYKQYVLVGVMSNFIPYKVNDKKIFIDYTVSSNILYFHDWIDSMLFINYIPTTNAKLTELYRQTIQLQLQLIKQKQKTNVKTK